ncbi:MAG: VTT domain-containing protein [Allorhizobium sp.]
MLATLISHLVEFLYHHPYIAYATVFLLALSESLPAIGAVLPGTAIIVTLSTLVPSGVLVFWPLLAAATCGAIAGDGLSFWLGHRFGQRFLSVWPFSRYPAAVRHSEAFFERYGARGIFLARFLPGVRAFVPLLAGIFGMGIARFYTVNVLSALVWAPAHVLSGILFGTAFHALGSAAKPLAGLLFTLLVLAWLLVKAIRYALIKGLPFLQRLGAGLLNILSLRKDPVSRFTLRLFDAEATETRAIAILLMVVIAAAFTFAGISEDVFTGDPLVQMDVAIYNLLQGFRSHPSDALMVVITELGDTVMVIAVSGAIIAYLLWRRATHALTYFASAVAGASLINTTIKVALHRTRPIDNLYTGWSAFSFPSGHSTVNMALYGAIAFLFVQHASGRTRFLAPMIAAVWVFSIAFSRIYLGAHWFSDVAGGVAFGLAWLSMLGLLLLQRAQEKLNPAVLAALPVMVLATFGVGHVLGRHETDMTRYALQQPVSHIDFSSWWVSGSKGDRRRIDITGDNKEPFALEWAGPLEPLAKALQATGWQTAAVWRPATLASFIGAGGSDTGVPAVPLLSSGRFADAVLIYPLQQNDQRLVMRLWRQPVLIDGKTTAHLWKATVTLERVRRPFGLVAIPTEEGDASERAVPLLVGALATFKVDHRVGSPTLRAYDRSQN